MEFEVIGEISDIETFAVGNSIRELPRLRRVYGSGRWRKRKGFAQVHLSDGTICKAEVHWYEAHGIGRKGIMAMTNKSKTSAYLLCVKNDDYPASLDVRKIYRMIPDEMAKARRFVRIVDESGDDYLYPKNYFVAIEVPKAAVRAFGRAS